MIKNVSILTSERTRLILSSYLRLKKIVKNTNTFVSYLYPLLRRVAKVSIEDVLFKPIIEETQKKIVF